MNEYHSESKIMGCDLAISIVAPSKDVADVAHETMQDIVRTADARFSRFIPNSELSELKATQSQVVSPEFMEVFLMAQRRANLTPVFSRRSQRVPKSWLGWPVPMVDYGREAITPMKRSKSSRSGPRTNASTARYLDPMASKPA